MKFGIWPDLASVFGKASINHYLSKCATRHINNDVRRGLAGYPTPFTIVFNKDVFSEINDIYAGAVCEAWPIGDKQIVDKETYSECASS